MPTTRPRFQVTETAAVAHAIDLAAKRWPGESRARLDADGLIAHLNPRSCREDLPRTAPS